MLVSQTTHFQKDHRKHFQKDTTAVRTFVQCLSSHTDPIGLQLIGYPYSTTMGRRKYTKDQKERYCRIYKEKCVGQSPKDVVPIMKENGWTDCTEKDIKNMKRWSLFEKTVGDDVRKRSKNVSKNQQVKYCQIYIDECMDKTGKEKVEIMKKHGWSDCNESKLQNMKTWSHFQDTVTSLLTTKTPYRKQQGTKKYCDFVYEICHSLSIDLNVN